MSRLAPLLLPCSFVSACPASGTETVGCALWRARCRVSSQSSSEICIRCPHRGHEFSARPTTVFYRDALLRSGCWMSLRARGSPLTRSRLHPEWGSQQKSRSISIGLHIETAIVVPNDSDADVRIVRARRLVTNVAAAKETVQVETKQSNWSHIVDSGRTPTQLKIERRLRKVHNVVVMRVAVGAQRPIPVRRSRRDLPHDFADNVILPEWTGRFETLFASFGIKLIPNGACGGNVVGRTCIGNARRPERRQDQWDYAYSKQDRRSISPTHTSRGRCLCGGYCEECEGERDCFHCSSFFVHSEPRMHSC